MSKQRFWDQSQMLWEEIKNSVLRFLQIHIYDVRYRILAETIFAGFYPRAFDFNGIIVAKKTFNIELEEVNTSPSEWEGIKVHSNGFVTEIVIRDFSHPWTQGRSSYQTSQMAENKRCRLRTAFTVDRGLIIIVKKVDYEDSRFIVTKIIKG